MVKQKLNVPNKQNLRLEDSKYTTLIKKGQVEELSSKPFLFKN